MKNYEVLNELVSKTQELHRAIFDKGYDQGQKDILEQQTCDNAISRQEAIKLIQRYGIGCFDAEEFSPEQCERFVISKLNSLPSITPKEKIGKWIDSEDWKERHYDSMNFRKHCSLCNGTGKIQDKFCPNCGARMVSE